MSRAVEKYYTVAETAMLMELNRRTVVEKLLKREFGDAVVDLAKKGPHDEPKTHDYRIPASGINAYLNARRVFFTTDELGVTARNEGELRRKASGKEAGE